VKYNPRSSRKWRLLRSLAFSSILIAGHSEVLAQTAQLSGRITDATAAVLRGAVRRILS